MPRDPTPPAKGGIDMTVVLFNMDGKPIKDDFDVGPADPRRMNDEWMAKLPDLTLGRAVAHALFVMTEPDNRLAAELRWARGALGERVRNEPNAVLTTEELALIKKQVGTVYGIQVVMRAMPLLDPNDRPPSIR